MERTSAYVSPIPRRMRKISTPGFAVTGSSAVIAGSTVVIAGSTEVIVGSVVMDCCRDMVCKRKQSSECVYKPRCKNSHRQKSHPQRQTEISTSEYR